MSTTLRAARDADIASVADLEEELFGVEAWDGPVLSDDLEREGRRFVVCADDEVVGYAITILAGDVVDLARIGVHPLRQREGIATGLLDHMLEAADEDGAERMLLEVSAANPEALAFYAAAGFDHIDTRTRYYKDGSDALVMQRLLSSGGPS